MHRSNTRFSCSGLKPIGQLLRLGPVIDMHEGIAGEGDSLDREPTREAPMAVAVALQLERTLSLYDRRSFTLHGRGGCGPRGTLRKLSVAVSYLRVSPLRPMVNWGTLTKVSSDWTAASVSACIRQRPMPFDRQLCSIAHTVRYELICSVSSRLLAESAVLASGLVRRPGCGKAAHHGTEKPGHT